MLHFLNNLQIPLYPNIAQFLLKFVDTTARWGKILLNIWTVTLGGHFSPIMKETDISIIKEIKKKHSFASLEANYCKSVEKYIYKNIYE